MKHGPGRQASLAAGRASTHPAGTRSQSAAPEAAPAEGLARRPEVEGEGNGDDASPRCRLAVDPLDPMARALYSHGFAFERVVPAAFTSAVPSSLAPPDTAALARVSLEHVMSRFVRRVAWSGDAHAGTARLELGAGALSGATLTIHSHQGAVRVLLELPPGVDRAEWRDRIARRLEARGLQVAALDVD